MSWHIVEHVLTKMDLPISERLVLLNLAYHADNETGECFPGIELLHSRTGLSQRQVLRLLARLEKSGHIELVRRGGQEKTRFIVTCHQCHPSAEDRCHECQVTSEDGCHGSPSRVTPVTEIGDTGDSAIRKNQSLTSQEPVRHSPQPKRKRFSPPSLAEVTAYCRERGNSVDAENFLDYVRRRVL